MSLDLGELVGRMRIDDKPFKAGLAKGEKEFKGFANHLNASSLALGAGIGLAFSKGFSFVKSSVTAASDLNETVSKVQQIFGPASKAITDFAETADKTFGESKQQALDAAATMAIFGKSAGLTGDNLSGFSIQMVKLAGDLASFHNTSPQDAIEAIGAALRGENQPIERYGVLINEASLSQTAFRMGLIKTTTQALTPQQHVLAAQKALLEQTKDAQGDFGRTASGAANQQRILTAEMENQKVKLGQQLLPAYLALLQAGSKLMSLITDHIVPAFMSAVKWIKENQSWLLTLVGTVATMTGAVYALVAAYKAWKAIADLVEVTQLAIDAAMAANPIGIVVIAIAALVAGFIYAYTHSERFRKIVQGTLRGVAESAKVVWAVLKVVFNAIVVSVKAVGAWFIWLWQHILLPVGRVIAAVASVIIKVFAIIGQNIRSAAMVWVWFYGKIFQPIIDLIMFQLRLWGDLFSWLWETIFSPIFKSIEIAALWLYDKALKPLVDKTMIGFRELMGVASALADWFGKVFSGVADVVGGMFAGVIGYIRDGINGLIDLLNKAIGFINGSIVKSLNELPGVDFTTIQSVPHLAGGGKVSPSAGGRAVVMGDGGQVEYGVPRSDMRQIIGEAVRAGTGGTIEIVVMDEMRRVRKKARAQGGQARGANAVLVGS